MDTDLFVRTELIKQRIFRRYPWLWEREWEIRKKEFIEFERRTNKPMYSWSSGYTPEMYMNQMEEVYKTQWINQNFVYLL